MTLDLWIVCVAAVLPLVPYSMVAAWKNRRGLYDPANPRDSNEALEGWARRAKAAEQNSWEALVQFLATSFVAYEAGADRALLGWLGLAWVVARLVYFGVYLAGVGRFRIAVWAVGVLLLVARVAAVFLPT